MATVRPIETAPEFRVFLATSPSRLRDQMGDTADQLRGIRDRISTQRDIAEALIEQAPRKMNEYLIRTTLLYAMAQAEEALEALHQAMEEIH